MTALLDRLVVPLAAVEDARATGRALSAHAPQAVIAVHVIEKAGGAPDKASVEQRETVAADIFAALEETLPETTVERDLRFGTDVAETIFAAAGDHDASAIAFTPRGGSRWVQLLTGDVALDLITNTDRPVIVLPDREDSQ